MADGRATMKLVKFGSGAQVDTTVSKTTGGSPKPSSTQGSTSSGKKT